MTVRGAARQVGNETMTAAPHAAVVLAGVIGRRKSLKVTQIVPLIDASGRAARSPSRRRRAT